MIQLYRLATVFLIVSTAAACKSSDTPDTMTAESAPLGFFITSSGPGDGANLGGLAGAYTHREMLTAGVGASDRTWRAYLSASAMDGKAAVNARDRIGDGPWYNAAGVLAAENVVDLHAYSAHAG